MKERTSLRISYKGLGEPLVMLCVLFFLLPLHGELTLPHSTA